MQQEPESVFYQNAIVYIFQWLDVWRIAEQALQCISSFRHVFFFHSLTHAELWIVCSFFQSFLRLVSLVSLDQESTIVILIWTGTDSPWKYSMQD